MKKWVITGVIVAALAALIVWRFVQLPNASPAQNAGRGPAAITVDTATPSRGSIRDWSEFSGSLLADSSFLVSPKITARLKEVAVDLGDAVTNGQTIAMLDDEEIVQDVEQSRAALHVARATVEEMKSTLNVARQEFRRVNELKEKKIVSEAEFENAQAAMEVQTSRLNVAAALVTQREAALRSAEIRLGYATITATWRDGSPVRFVGRRFVDEGILIRVGDPIVLLLDLDVITAALAVSEKDYARLKPGLDVQVSADGLPGKVFPGKVSRIAPQLDEQTRQARVEVTIPNADHALKPGMFIIAGIEFARHEDTVLLPLSAIVHREGKNCVFVVDTEKSTVRLVPIQTGLAERDRIEILSPVLAGPVVTLGHHLLADGSRVALTGPAGTGGKRAGGQPGIGGKRP
jgi:RND family efflux transporter MFP subunit